MVSRKDHEERAEHLRQYILGCIKAGMLVPADLMTGSFVEKLVGVIGRDSKLVIRDLARQGIGNLMTIGMMHLGKMAANAAKK